MRGIHRLSVLSPTWWRHQMGPFYALLAICAGNSPVTGEFPAQRPVTRSFDVFFDLLLNKRLSKQWWDWWFKTPSRPLWRHSNRRADLDAPCAVHIFHLLFPDNGLKSNNNSKIQTMMNQFSQRFVADGIWIVLHNFERRFLNRNHIFIQIPLTILFRSSNCQHISIS